MMPSNSHGLIGTDADALLRAIAQLRERMRLQETELDNLRVTTRFLHQMNERDPITGGPGVSVADPAILDRIERLEARSVEQGSTVQQILAVLTRTDTNLQRIAAELDRLLAGRVVVRPVPNLISEAAPPLESDAAPAEFAEQLQAHSNGIPVDVNPFPAAPPADYDPFEDEEDQRVTHVGWKASVLGIVVIIGLVIGAVFVIRHARRVAAFGNDASAASVFSPMERARLFENDRKYPEAEAIYRDMLKRDPQNADAVRHLASVLFRENKIEESSVVLKQLVASGSDAGNSQ